MRSERVARMWHNQGGKIADGLSEQIKAARRAPAANPVNEADGHATGTGSASGA